MEQAKGSKKNGSMKTDAEGELKQAAKSGMNSNMKSQMKSESQSSSDTSTGTSKGKPRNGQQSTSNLDSSDLSTRSDADAAKDDIRKQTPKKGANSTSEAVRSR